MTKGKLIVLLVCFCVLYFNAPASPDIQSFVKASAINPAKKVSPTEISIKEIFAKEFNILTFALGMYQLDVGERLSKENIKMRLSDEVLFCKEAFSIVFDMENIDFNRKGFTRYYPFSVNGKDFIIRIFDADEKCYLADFEIFYDGVLEESNIGFQIIPGVKEILADTKAGKLSISDPAAFTTNP